MSDFSGERMPDNTLYYGDNLKILRDYVADESVDLVYLDPPFNSNADYNVLFEEKGGEKAHAQIKAFEDTWEWDTEALANFTEAVENGGSQVARAMLSLRSLLGTSDMLAYLSMMAPRLIELRRVMKRTGSIYLHCDTTASHYLKLLMDAVFQPANFRSQITWKRTNAHSDSKDWSDVSDIILYSVKDRASSFRWNPIYLKHSDEHVKSKFAKEENGRFYSLGDMTSPHPRPNMMYEWKGFPSPPMGWRYSKDTMKELDAAGRIWYPEDKGKRPRLKKAIPRRNVWNAFNERLDGYFPDKFSGCRTPRLSNPKAIRIA
ncbi:MAG TPA: DNA methyltransferase [Tepidisphaeraceae bacterium]|nr:DNA methyltransferase [Tepidisphaeraceae bacterium]